MSQIKNWKRFLTGWITLFLALSCLGCSSGEPETETKDTGTEESKPEKEAEFSEDPEVKKIVRNLAGKYAILPETISILVEDLETRSGYQYQPEVLFYGASIYKLPLAMIYYDAIRQKLITGDERLTYSEEILDIGQEDLLYLQSNALSVKQLLEVMIVDSDNEAGHILFEHVKDLDLSKLECGFKIERADLDGLELSSPENGQYLYQENEADQINASFVGYCLRYIYENREIYQKLLKDMMASEPSDYLNQDNPKAYYQKYGALETVVNIAGLHLADAPFEVVVFSEYEEHVMEFLSELGEELLKYYSDQK